MAMEAAAPAEDRWVQCDTCEKWRRVTDDKADVRSEKRQFSDGDGGGRRRPGGVEE